MSAVMDTLSEKLDESSLKAIDNREMKRKLLDNLTNEVFYHLFVNKKVILGPGFGSIILKDIKEHTKKVFSKKSNVMVSKTIRGKKVVYVPGSSVNELL